MANFFAAVKDNGEVVDAVYEVNPIVKRDPFDVSQVSDLFGRFHTEIDVIKSEAESIVVADDTSYAEAQERLGTARKLKTAIDKKRKELKEPYLAFTRVLDGEANGLSSRLDAIATAIQNTKLLPYAQMKERQRREIEEQARREAAARQAELDRQAKADADRLAAEARAVAEAAGKDAAQAEQAAQAAIAMAEPAPVVIADIPKETKVSTDSATSKIVYDWKWDVVSFSDIPAEIWEERREHVIKALAPAINAKVKAGIRNIAGIKIYKVEDLKVTTKR